MCQDAVTEETYRLTTILGCFNLFFPTRFISSFVTNQLPSIIPIRLGLSDFGIPEVKMRQLW